MRNAAAVRKTLAAMRRVGVGHVNNKLSLKLLLALVTAFIILVPSGKAHAAPRYFQMSLWECCGGPTPTSAQTDIRSEGDGGLGEGVCPPQPAAPARSIIVNLEYAYSLSTLDHCMNWSLIVAVEVDEPYNNAGVDQYLTSCTPQQPALNNAIATVDTQLQARATELQARNSKARFWVNFNPTEANWMAGCNDTQLFNRSYFDVVSEDQYYTSFTTGTVLTSFYEQMAANPATPSQQLAFIPGVFVTTSQSQYGYLGGYFSNANSFNASCSLPLGSRGVTGIYDGCPVWIVMGWMTGTSGSDYGIFSAGAANILTAWEAWIAYTPTNKRTPAQFLPPIIQLML